MFFVAAFLIFSVALYAAGYYIWTVPQRQAEELLSGRLREPTFPAVHPLRRCS